jgi:hypothetical protein
MAAYSAGMMVALWVVSSVEEMGFLMVEQLVVLTVA